MSKLSIIIPVYMNHENLKEASSGSVDKFHSFVR